MKKALLATTVLGLGALALAARPLQAQDVMLVAKEHYKVLVDNENVRVVENTLKPGEKDARHTHPAGWYIVTKGGRMQVVFANGKKEMWEPKTGESGWSPAEDAHTSENVGTAPMTYILVEIKHPAGAGAGSPVEIAQAMAAVRPITQR